MEGFKSNGSEDVKNQIINQVKQEAAMGNAKTLIGSINKHCFSACIAKPGPSLSGGEAQCLSHCMDKYMKAWDTVNRAYIERAQAEVKAGIAGTGQGLLSI